MRLTTALLLTDPTYRAWFRRPPPLPSLAQRNYQTAPWYYYVLREQKGPWARATTRTYADAFARLRADLRRYHDVVITSRSVAFPAPPDIRRRTKRNPAGVWDFRMLWPEADATYQWCLYCRRPTRFLRFRTHHAFPALTMPAAEGEPAKTMRVVVEGVRRCEVCGVSLPAKERR
jgi:hypothetical protein